MVKLWNREPALLLGALNAIIALAVGFGLNLTPEQIGLILGATSAIIAFVTRSQVAPTKT